jgi:hypothetical protein
MCQLKQPIILQHVFCTNLPVSETIKKTKNPSISRRFQGYYYKFTNKYNISLINLHSLRLVLTNIWIPLGSVIIRSPPKSLIGVISAFQPTFLEMQSHSFFKLTCLSFALPFQRQDEKG